MLTVKVNEVTYNTVPRLCGNTNMEREIQTVVC
jgi:hypothetical protein